MPQDKIKDGSKEKRKKAAQFVGDHSQFKPIVDVGRMLDAVLRKIKQGEKKNQKKRSPADTLFGGK